MTGRFPHAEEVGVAAVVDIVVVPIGEGFLKQAYGSHLGSRALHDSCSTTSYICITVLVIAHIRYPV